MNRRSTEHARVIEEQFTLQAEPFAALPIHTHEESSTLLRDGLRLTGRERVLDAGCGPGLVALYLAAFADAVIGVDATAAMIDKARALAAERGVVNATFERGRMESLPFQDASFDAVVTRYTLHHVLDARAAFAEMVRVCRPGGRVVVCDATPRAEHRDAYDAWERVRDPSHTSARTPEELRGLAEGLLDDVAWHAFRLPADVDALLASSFPAAGDAERLRDAMVRDVGAGALGVDARWEGGALRMSFPVGVVSGATRA